MPAKEIEIDPLDRPVWGIVRIAKVINASPKRTEHLLNAGVLDADEFSANKKDEEGEQVEQPNKRGGGKRGPGKRWVSTPRRLLRQFSGEASS